MSEGCTVGTARCETARPATHDTPECCRGHVRRVVARVARVLDTAGVVWWADYGTLLGAVREGGMIPWDNDADIGVLERDFGHVLALIPELRAEGLAAHYHPPGEGLWGSGHYLNVTASAVNGNGLDLFPWHERDKRLHRRRYADMDRAKGRDFPVSWLEPRGRLDFDGLSLAVPARSAWLLAHRYGPDWMAPQRIAKSGMEVVA